MKQLLTTLLALMTLTVQGRVKHILPTPQHVEYTGESFATGRRVSVTDPTACALLREVLTEARCRICPEAKAHVTVTLVDSISGTDEPALAGYESEVYELSITRNNIDITATSRLGVIRAAQTLQQLIEDERGRVHSIEGVHIIDWPAFRVRGFMHDVGRSFITYDELCRQLLLYSRFKLNTFQWHMTENQAWRFQVLSYPQLTQASSMTRFPGQFYTQEQCHTLDSLAHELGIYIIPEIDMPGHSEAFQRAMGFDMQTPQGITVLKQVLNEVAACFPHAPYLHIGGDEVTIREVDGVNFLTTMSDYVHQLGRRVLWWNPTRNVSVSQSVGCDMAQCWSTRGRQIRNLPCIDCRYNYTNHFDVFADLAGIYRSNILYKPHGDSETAGFISCPWNDRLTPTQEDIIAQNNIFAVTLASGERAWKGGGLQYIEQSGAVLPNEGPEYDEFCDWERRFLFHKSHSLASEPIPYVRQTDLQWHISDPIANGGDASATFLWDEFREADTSIPDEVTVDGHTYGWTLATGAGIYLSHTWSSVIPGIWGLQPALNQTAYAYTYVYSKRKRTVNALIEFQNYGRSEKDPAPPLGQWDWKGSDVWVNGCRIDPPVWGNAGHPGGDNEHPLLNENFPARPPVVLHLRRGWNKVFLKLPCVATPCRLNKWQFTFCIIPDSKL